MPSKRMSTKERVFHSILFEGLALLIVVPVSIILMNSGTVMMTGLTVSMSLIAMVWNYIYNLGFDAAFGHERIKRGLVMRICHSLGFEIGFLLVTVPLTMWALDIGFWPAVVFDIGLALFYLAYTTIFNYVYDHVRFRLVEKNQLSEGRQT